MRIFEPGDLRIFKITDKTLGIMLLAVLTLELILLAVYVNRPFLNIYACSNSASDTVILAILMTFKFGLLVFGLVVAVRIWRAPQDGYNESRPIAFSIYNIAFFAVVVFGLQVSETLNPQVMFVLRGVSIVCATLITVCVIFGHKVLLLHRKPSGAISPICMSITRCNPDLFSIAQACHFLELFRQVRFVAKTGSVPPRYRAPHIPMQNQKRS
jgi:hypothetical protein